MEEEEFRRRFPLIAKLADKIEEKNLKIVWDEECHKRLKDSGYYDKQLKERG